jgi:hypothetical protein
MEEETERGTDAAATCPELGVVPLGKELGDGDVREPDPVILWCPLVIPG